jgi:hypothetical protein
VAGLCVAFGREKTMAELGRLIGESVKESPPQKSRNRKRRLLKPRGELIPPNKAEPLKVRYNRKKEKQNWFELLNEEKA